MRKAVKRVRKVRSLLDEEGESGLVLVRHAEERLVDRFDPLVLRSAGFDGGSGHEDLVEGVEGDDWLGEIAKSHLQNL